MHNKTTTDNMMAFTVIFILVASARLMSHGCVATTLCTIPYCPPPWRTFQGHCYLWVGKPMSWMDAKRHCQKLSRPGKMVHLASIHSKEEDEFVGEHVRNEKSAIAANRGYWIGFNDREQENVFKWVDGSDVGYENWKQNEPNNLREEDCVEVLRRSDEWNDYKCREKLQFVCKV